LFGSVGKFRALRVPHQKPNRGLTIRHCKAMATLEEVSVVDEINQDILNSSTNDIVAWTRPLENEIKV